jgi:poly(A) polymerase
MTRHNDPPDPLRQELLDALDQGKLAPTIRSMSERGVLGEVLPEVEALKGVEQSPEHHAEGDVFVHTLLVLENAKTTPLIQLGALLHDTGKLSTQEVLPDRIRFLGHEEVSEEIARRVLHRLGLDEYIEGVCLIIGQHMRVNQSLRWRKRTVRKFVREIGEHLEDSLALAEADAAGSLGPGSRPADQISEKLRRRIRELDNEPPPVPKGPRLPISGHDIMRVLKVPPGPEVGKAQRWLQERPQSEGMTAEDAECLLRESYAPERN